MSTQIPDSERTGRDYWRSLEELADTPEFREHLEKEHPGGTAGLLDSVSRRNFLGIMGAALAMSGLTGCRRPLAKILPYSKSPEELLPGVPMNYATVWSWRGAATGLLVESTDGRPTKIEGNPDHPASLGATDHFSQAALLQLYDPDRSTEVLRGGESSTWREFDAWARDHFQGLAGRAGRGLHVLRGVNASPAVTAMEEEVRRRFPEAVWHTWEPVSRENVLEGARIALGRALRTHVDYEQADVVLALDSDFLMMEPSSVRDARGFSRARRVTGEGDDMNRLYAVESLFTVTGAHADHRLRLPSSQVADFGAALAVKLVSSHGVDLGVDVETLRQGGAARSWSPDQVRWLDAVAKDLAAHRGRCVITVGPRQPVELHALGHALNRALGAVGPIVRYTEDPDPGRHTDSIRALADRLEAGSVDTLLVLGSNPAYAAPSDLDLPGRMGKARHVIHLGLHADETAALAEWHLPQAHFLESWGDGRGWDGTLGIQQPLIAPLHGGRSELEVLGLLAGRVEPDGYGLMLEIYGRQWGEGRAFTARWERALHDGVVPGTAYPEVVTGVNPGAITASWRGRRPAGDPSREGLELVLHEDPSVQDGRFANLAWLQELPDPMTKLTWDNAAMVSPATARALGVEKEDVLRLGVDGRSLEVPVWVQPGVADWTIALALGYGRRRAGRVGNGVGVDAYPLRTTSAGSILVGVAAGKLEGRRHRLASTQDHHALEGRPIVREGTLEQYREHPDFVEHMVEVPPYVDMYPEREYDFSEGHQWGMTVDLNTCTGCSACITACQAENNIATVGRDEVLRGREMHWIRLDRYFVGDEDAPEAVQQPVLCMQCENAPCEAVCPVNATAHSDDGLNDMTYNRCIGTRYCSNNCPYKVRRFNFFDYNRGISETEKMGKNPEVTVRMRGVMEKCTYCVQRIRRAGIRARVEDRPIRDGEIRTACQQVCPTESIVFGDVNDPASAVSAGKARNLNYSMLEYVNTKPRTTYLARLRNPNPELEHS